jgi:hypothetical protein
MTRLDNETGPTGALRFAIGTCFSSPLPAADDTMDPWTLRFSHNATLEASFQNTYRERYGEAMRGVRARLFCTAEYRSFPPFRFNRRRSARSLASGS